MVELFTRFDAKDESAARSFAERLADLQRSVPSKPGNLHYEVFTTRESATTLFVRERWARQADADRHVASVMNDPESHEALEWLVGDPTTFTLLSQAAAEGDAP